MLDIIQCHDDLERSLILPIDIVVLALPRLYRILLYTLSNMHCIAQVSFLPPFLLFTIILIDFKHLYFVLT